MAMDRILRNVMATARHRYPILAAPMLLFQLPNGCLHSKNNAQILLFTNVSNASMLIINLETACIMAYAMVHFP